MKTNKTLRIVLEIIFAILAIILIYVVIRYWEQGDVHTGQKLTEAYTDTQIQVSARDEDTTIVLGNREYQMTHPVKTYLFLGTDASGNEEGVGEEYRGSMADAFMLLVIDEQEQTYGILQLNRDTITRVPLMQTDGSANASAQIQLCTAHWYGGNKKQSCENTVDTVGNMLGGLPIDGYYALSMDAMDKLNQAVGGVKMTFTEELTEIDPQMKKGATLTLTDEQAEKLMHARYEMADDRNEKRMERQRLFLDAFLAQVREKQAKDSDFIIKLYDSLHPYCTEDINMNALTKLIGQMGKYTSKGTYAIDGESKIGQKLGDGLDHWEFYMDEDSLDETMNTLYPLTYVGVAEEEPEE